MMRNEFLDTKGISYQKHKSCIFVEEMQNHPGQPVIAPVAMDQ
jgi:hypothetical protein